MVKKIYIAAPFFTEEQLHVVHAVEHAIRMTSGLDYYSPRTDGVLKDMTPEERIKAGPKLFTLNCKMIRECHGVLALMDFKDTGTTWETGFAYGIGKPICGFRTDPTERLNIMVGLCFNAVAYGEGDLANMLHAYASAEFNLDAWAGHHREVMT